MDIPQFVLILFLLSPLPVYWFVPLIDILHESRAYALVTPISLLFAAYLPFPLFWIALFAALSAKRAACYSDPISYWESAVRDQGADKRALLNLGSFYQASGKIQQARDTNIQLVEKYPNFGLAWVNLAMLDEKLAESEYMKTLQAQQQLGPEHQKAKEHAYLFNYLMWNAIKKVHLGKHLNPLDPATAECHSHVFTVARKLKVLN